MPPYIAEWSLTRRKMFSNCARRFAIKYLAGKSRETKKIYSTKWFSPWDLMIITTRQVFFQWLEDLHKGVAWTDKMLYSKIRFGIITNLYQFNSQGLSDVNLSKNRLISKSYARLKGLLRQPLIKKLSKGGIKEWSYHERTRLVTFGHLEVYCSPDVVFRIGNKWHLVRLNFQSEIKQPYFDLELTTMLLWSKGNQYLPNLESKFTIYGIFYRQGKWYQKRIKPNQRMLQETKQLLEKDVHYMNILQNELDRTNDIDSLPLTNSPVYCKRCPYQANCPVNT